jgi:transposase InsO family protein
VGKLHIGPDGVIYAEPHRGKQRPVVPFHLEVAFVRECHELIGHRGIEATAAIAGQSAYLLAGKAAVQHVLAACVPCQVKAGAPRPQRHTYATVKNGYPFQRISIDFVGPLPRTKKGHTMALTVKDPFSKWIEAFPLRRATAEAVAHHLEKDIFTRFGFPEEIHSDRGSQFTGELMTQLGQLLGVRTTVTPAYHPQSNPVERAHRDLKAGLRAALEEAGGQEWDEAIPQILLAFRIAPARGTAMSPFRVLFGRDPPLPIGVIEPAPAHTALVPYVEDLEKRMRVVHEWAAKNLAKEVRRQQMAYGAGGWTPKKGDKVWLYSPAATASTGRKLARPWTGPWGVESVISEVLYRIVDSRGRGVDAALDRLKPFYEPPGGQFDSQTSNRRHLPCSPELDQEQPQQRHFGHQASFQWTGNPASAATDDGVSSDGEGTGTEGDDGSSGDDGSAPGGAGGDGRSAPGEAGQLGAGSPAHSRGRIQRGPSPGPTANPDPTSESRGEWRQRMRQTLFPSAPPLDWAAVEYRLTEAEEDEAWLRRRPTSRRSRGCTTGRCEMPGGARCQAGPPTGTEGQDGRRGVAAGHGGQSGQD